VSAARPSADASGASLPEALAPFLEDPARTAILLDVDGTLAPIVRHPDDAVVPETTRARINALAKRYGVVACVSGRAASDARRLVGIGSITYIGNHGGEILHHGGGKPEIDPELGHWIRRVQDFKQGVTTPQLHRERVRLEDKGTIVAFHWRGAPNEAAAEDSVREIAESAEEAGFQAHWGRKVLEVRPPVEMHKGVGVARLVRDADLTGAIYIGDDTTDLDAFGTLRELVENGRLERSLSVGVRADEGPPEVVAEADIVVDGVEGVRDVLAQLDAH